MLILVTRSVDLGVVIEGEVELELDDGSSTVLRAGTSNSMGESGLTFGR
jgi:uncharacterized cupin superfamily protein